MLRIFLEWTSDCVCEFSSNILYWDWHWSHSGFFCFVDVYVLRVSRANFLWKKRRHLFCTLTLQICCTACNRWALHFFMHSQTIRNSIPLLKFVKCTFGLFFLFIFKICVWGVQRSQEIEMYIYIHHVYSSILCVHLFRVCFSARGTCIVDPTQNIPPIEK